VSIKQSLFIADNNVRIYGNLTHSRMQFCSDCCKGKIDKSRLMHWAVLKCYKHMINVKQMTQIYQTSSLDPYITIYNIPYLLWVLFSFLDFLAQVLNSRIWRPLSAPWITRDAISCRWQYSRTITIEWLKWCTIRSYIILQED